MRIAVLLSCALLAAAVGYGDEEGDSDSTHRFLSSDSVLVIPMDTIRAAYNNSGDIGASLSISPWILDRSPLLNTLVDPLARIARTALSDSVRQVIRLADIEHQKRLELLLLSRALGLAPDRRDRFAGYTIDTPGSDLRIIRLPLIRF